MSEMRDTIGVSHMTLLRMLQSGKILAMKLPCGRGNKRVSYRVKRKDFEKFVESVSVGPK